MKKILVALVILLLGVLGFGYWHYFYIPPLPQEEGAKAVNYVWDYKGQKYQLAETLYSSIDGYYGDRSKGIFQGLESSSVEKYLELDAKSPETAELAEQISDLAKTRHLNEDQTLELAVAFIQAIPYDEARARTDLTHPRYPYEVLFENTGICSDKTLLAVSLLRSLGYGTAVFMWDSEQHMSAAVSCPKEYSNYGTGYCIVETTAVGAKIGVVPDLSTSTLKAVGRTTLGSYGQDNQNVMNLGNAEIYSEQTGKLYQGVYARLTIEREIASIEEYLKNQKIKISSGEGRLEEMKNQLDGYYAAKNFSSYNALVPTYNRLVSSVKSDISAYNEKVSRYNYLIKQ